MNSTVAIVRCESYDQATVNQAIEKAIALLGGIEQFVTPDENILIKPNMLSAKEPEAPVTTHPAVLEAVIKLFKEQGCNNLTYGDSPGWGMPQRTARLCGYEVIAKKWDVPLADFVSGSTVAYEKGEICTQFEIATGVQNADAIISVSKMKAHQLTRITGAVKNQLGCVNGFNKASYHAKYPSAVKFSEMLIDLNRLLAPRLFIMDGVVAMEGNGPSSGVAKQMNIIIASKDPVAVDATFCKLINLNPEYIPSLVYGEKCGYGNYRDSYIDYVGDKVEAFIQTDFDAVNVPVKEEKFKKASTLQNLFMRKPVIDKSKCIGCGVCVEACPLEEKAIGIQPNSMKPKYNYQSCIRCYCCQEMCPKRAIDVKTPILGKITIYRKQTN